MYAEGLKFFGYGFQKYNALFQQNVILENQYSALFLLYLPFHIIHTLKNELHYQGHLSRDNIDMNINCTFYLQKSQHCTFNVINVFIRSSLQRSLEYESYLQDFAEFTSHNFVEISESYKSYQHCVSLNLLHFCCLWATIQNYDVGLAHI